MMNQISAITGSTSTAAAASDKRNDALGQQEFLTLMAAQLKNQDPFQPMENGDFLAQMAQFSAVQGLDDVNANLNQISTQIGGQRLTTGASLMGQYVLVPGSVARADADGAIHGSINLPEAASTVTVQYRDARSAEVLFEQDLGPQSAGAVPFDWSNLPADLAASRGAVRVSVQADTTELPTVSVFARVSGVQMPANSQEMNLELEDYGVLSSLEVTSIR